VIERLVVGVVIAIFVSLAFAAAVHFARHDADKQAWQPCAPPTSADSYLIVVSPDGARHPLCIGGATKLLLAVSNPAFTTLTSGGNASGLNGTFVIGRNGVFAVNGHPVGKP